MSALERELQELAALVEWPNAPDVSAAVAAAAARDSGSPGSHGLSWLRPRVALGVAALVLAVGLALAVPPARTAIFDWLGIGSARIERVEELPALPLTVPVELLGERTTLSDARRRAGFPVAPPPHDEPEPDEVRVVDGRRVSYLWRDGEGIRLLVTQVPGLLQRGEILYKLIPPNVRIERLTIDGDGAVFLSGGPHAVYLLELGGDFRRDPGWLAGATLLVDRGGTTLRIEGSLSRDDAVALARSMT